MARTLRMVVHGTSNDGRVPLTLEEALKANVVRVYETRSVNELAIENLGRIGD
jgi:hypothetical protein